MKEAYIECGICGQYHKLEYMGDCRNDEERFKPEDIPKDASIVDFWDEREKV